MQRRRSTIFGHQSLGKTWRQQKEATNLLMRRHFLALNKYNYHVLMVFAQKIMQINRVHDTFCCYLPQWVPTAKIGSHYLLGSRTLHKRDLIFELHIGNLLSVRRLKVVNDHNASFCLLAICALFSLSRSSSIASRGE